MGTIRKRNNIKGITYLARVRLNKKDISKTFLKKEFARKWLADTEYLILKNNTINFELSKLTLKELIYKYINEVVNYQKSNKQFINRWKRIIKLNPDLVQLKIINITPVHILNYRNNRLKDGRRTTNLDLVMLHTLFEKAIKIWQIPIISNPVKYVEKFPETKGRYRPIYFSEYKKILKYSLRFNLKLYLAITILKNCGLRPNEVVSLNHQDIDKKSRLLVIRKSKTNQTRTVPINLFIINLIDNSYSIYKSAKIVPLTINGLNSSFAKMKKRLCITNLKLHDFRRNFARRYLDKHRGDIPNLARIGGWSSWDMVQRYYGK